MGMKIPGGGDCSIVSDIMLRIGSFQGKPSSNSLREDRREMRPMLNEARPKINAMVFCGNIRVAGYRDIMVVHVGTSSADYSCNDCQGNRWTKCT